jgi:hypothetical protein
MSVLNYSFDAQIAFIQKARADKKFVIDQPFTPVELIKEIQSNIKCRRNSSIAVMFTIEWAIYLVNEGYTNVTFLYSVEDKNIQKVCNLYGIKCIIVDEAIKNMKTFDVVVGNPPYQTTGEKKSKLWVDFLDKALALSTDVVSFVTPSVWVSGSNKNARNTRKSISKYSLDYVDLTAGRYFSVGEEICAYQILMNSDKITTTVKCDHFVKKIMFDGSPLLLSEEDELIHSILDRISSHQTIQSDLDRFMHRRPEDMSRFSMSLDQKFKNKVYYSSTETWYTDLDTSSFAGPKIIFNNSGYYFKPDQPDRYMWTEDSGVALGNAFQLVFSDSHSRDNALTVFRSSFYVFLVNAIKTGGFNAGALYRLPKVDFTRSWTDAELYQHFNLTQEEIDYIEKTVK